MKFNVEKHGAEDGFVKVNNHNELRVIWRVTVTGIMLHFSLFCDFFILFNAPVASASGGGVTIESESINLVDFETTDESYFELEFNLSSTDEGLGVNYVGQVYFEASAIDGTVIINSSISYDLVEGVQQQISYNFTSLNYGYTLISVGLTGDVGIESQNDLSNFGERFID